MLKIPENFIFQNVMPLRPRSYSVASEIERWGQLSSNIGGQFRSAASKPVSKHRNWCFMVAVLKLPRRLSDIYCDLHSFMCSLPVLRNWTLYESKIKARLGGVYQTPTFRPRRWIEVSTTSYADSITPRTLEGAPPGVVGVGV